MHRSWMMVVATLTMGSLGAIGILAGEGATARPLAQGGSEASACLPIPK